jgi:nitroreductase
MTDALHPLLTRRSTSVRDLAAPAPREAELEQILTIATRVPDHGKLCPWRIIILKGEGALKLGAIAADQFAKQQPEATEAQIAAEHTRFTRAPLCLAVISTPKLGTKPVWEQELSAGAVCLNILHAANALGYGAKWLTEWVAYDEAILAALLNTAPATDTLDGPARIAGFIYLGTKTAETPDRERPMLENVVGEF